MPLKIESQGNGSREMKFVAQALFLSGMGPFVCRLSPTNVKICCFNGLALGLGGVRRVPFRVPCPWFEPDSWRHGACVGLRIF